MDFGYADDLVMGFEHRAEAELFLLPEMKPDREYASDVQHLRSMQGIMRTRLGIAMMLACCVLTGCTTQPPVTRDALIGSYVYKSEDPEGKPLDHQWDRLTLQADEIGRAHV